MDTDAWKKTAARAAAERVEDGMLVGLGTGTTASEAIKKIAERKPDCSFVPSSSSTEKLARELRLKLTDLKYGMKLDLMIDGADEVDPELNMIKGHGGAHTREKILAMAARRVIIVVDRTKLVRRLGERMPVPVEVIPFAHEKTMENLEKIGGRPMLRTAGGAPFVTDNGNYVVDVKFGRIDKPSELELRINSMPGVVENGIFVGLADEVIVGHEGGCCAIRSRGDFAKFIRLKK
ncbi:MAG: ribose-5-phosphate isomerase RpiA [Candidatus Hadarchaeales archaeon]